MILTVTCCWVNNVTRIIYHTPMFMRLQCPLLPKVDHQVDFRIIREPRTTRNWHNFIVRSIPINLVPVLEKNTNRLFS
jgi:hypothetical protein